MDYATIGGLTGAFVLLLAGVMAGEITAVFLNIHGIAVVFGGTLVAMLINTPLNYFVSALRMMFGLIRSDPHTNTAELIQNMTRLAETVQRNGLGSLRNVDGRAAGGFLAAASTTALEYNNPEFVRTVLETEVNNQVDRSNEVINVIRTAGVVAPMFGLIGTLLGIIQVLKNISDPSAVGGSMATAITSAFYGIVFANVVCIPVAGKLRMRLWEEVKMKAMVIEGVIGMMQGTVPLVLERRLEAFK